MTRYVKRKASYSFSDRISEAECRMGLDYLGISSQANLAPLTGI